MQRADLARALRKVARATGEFALRSGASANEYFDKHQFEAEPNLLRATARHLTPLVPQETEVLAGLELDGVPIAVALALETGLPLAFVGKVGNGFGDRGPAEVAALSGRKVLVVEDVVTSGGRIVASVTELRESGANVLSAVCVIDRQSGGGHALGRIGLSLSALFTQSELESCSAELAAPTS